MNVWNYRGLISGRFGRELLRSFGRLAVVACVATASVGLAPDAHAQGRRMNMGMRAGMGGNSAVTTREVNKWADMLKLTADQKAAVDALHDAYQEQHQAEAKALEDLAKDAQQEFMETQDTSVFKDMASKSAEHTARMADLERQFLEDFKAVLDPKQTEQWPAVERYHRRVKSLPGGMLAGENVDLVAIFGELDIADPPPGLADALDRYEIDLDRALTDRDEQRRDLEKQGQDMMKDFDPSKMDFSKIRQMMQDTRKTGIRVRDVNERHARLIAAALPDDKKADFESRVRKATFPMVYREPYTSKAVDAALEFNDLSSDQKASIQTLKATYTRELAAADEKWAAAIATEEKDGGGDPFMGFGRFVPGGNPDDVSPTEDAKKTRRELDKSTLEKLKAILTPEQAEKLPEREVENPWMANFGGRGGDDADEKANKSGSRNDRKK